MLKVGDRVTPIHRIAMYGRNDLAPGTYYTVSACNDTHCMLTSPGGLNSPVYESKLFKKIFDRNDVIERIINVKSISGEFAKDIASEIRREMEGKLSLV